MTQSDKWKKRKCVLEYRAFADEMRLRVPRGTDLNNHAILFTMPMPKSWSKKKKAEMDFKPHKSRPDIDNLLKAVFDALYKEDSGIWQTHAAKVWGYEGSIQLREMPESRERLQLVR